ncbi:MAG: hypothetical protein ACLFQ8_00675 [Candidatus Aenigmatarchaeota archaeon]
MELNDLEELKSKLEEMDMDYRIIEWGEDYDPGCSLENALLPYTMKSGQAFILEQGNSVYAVLPPSEEENAGISEENTDEGLDINKYCNRLITPEANKEE